MERELIRLGVVTRDEICQMREDWRKATKLRRSQAADAAKWGILPSLAMKHGRLHGVPSAARITHQKDGSAAEFTPQPRCNDRPCKQAGVSAALLELSLYRDEARSPEVEVVDDLQELARGLESLRPQIQRLRGAGGRGMASVVALSARVGVDEGRFWPALVGLAQRGEALVDEAHGVVSLGRRQFRSRQLRVNPRRKGRRRFVLLGAIWRQLLESGYSPREAATLVPDANPIRRSGHQIARVKWHATRLDFRRILLE